MEDYEVLTRVGAGTPMGKLFRRYWVPAALSAELVSDGSPVRLRILGEDLVAFRDTQGRVGIVDAYCPHRGAPLFFGRNEDCSLRCSYHGWQFDIDGNCLDVPNIVAPSNIDAIKQRLKITSYPAREAGGMVWTYMGSGATPPPLPSMEWLDLPQDHVHVSRWLQRSNWLQGLEGEIDSAHISFMHGLRDYENDNMRRHLMMDGAPEITVREIDNGFVYGARRRFGDMFSWRVTTWLMPMWSVTGPFHPDPSVHGRGWMPVDDEHTITFAYKYKHEPYTAEQNAFTEEGLGFPPRRKQMPYTLPDGTRIDTFVPTATRENDYLINRELQRTVRFSGIEGVNEEDRSLQESMRRIAGRPGTTDRSFENLVRSDNAIVAARRKLLRTLNNMDTLQPDAPCEPVVFSTKTPISDFDELMEAHSRNEVVHA